MPGGYITNAMVAGYSAAFDLLHSGFARPITIFQTATQLVITTNPQHNFLYGNSSNPQNTTVQNIIQSGNYFARIHYPEMGKTNLLDNILGKKEQIGVENKDWQVKLIVDEPTYNVIASATRLVFESGYFERVTDPIPHFVVGTKYFDVYLKALS